MQKFASFRLCGPNNYNKNVDKKICGVHIGRVNKAMIYYRVAWKTKQSSTWQWKSTKLESISAVMRFVKAYSALPTDSLRVFLSSTIETMDEMLARENQGLVSNSVRADELLWK